MKRFTLLLAALLCMQRGLGQPSITAAEYFFDADPGVGGGTPIAVPSPAPTVNLSATIPTTSLTPGFHFLAVRSRNAAGHWSHFESRGVYVTTSAATGGAITAAEFFVDADPGLGAATPMSVGAAGTTVNFSAVLPTNAFLAGFHFLAIRVRDAAGRWSLYEQRGFYVNAATASAGAITAAEYFIDADPGNGAGLPLAIGANGTQVTFAASIPTTSLAPGFHFLAIRTRDASGRWSLFENRGFYISTSTGSSPAISAAEYFIDTDPGVGAAIPLAVGTPGGTTSFVASIPTTSLPAGFHTLAIRVRDAGGKWGLFESRMFYITTPAAASSPIVRGEYFLDTDPGIGAGTPFTYATPALVQTQPVIATIPPGTIAGAHVLILRVQDAAGRWSPIDTANFTVTSVPLSTTGLRFGATRQGAVSLLEWLPVEAERARVYSVERSSNGREFSALHEQAAAGAATYAYTDAQPLAGLNYYRIRLTMPDGAIGFSGVATVLHGAGGEAVQLGPNPTDGLLWFSGITGTATVRVFAASGALAATYNVLQGTGINVSGLASGVYRAEVDDKGGTTTRLQFVKR